MPQRRWLAFALVGQMALVGFTGIGLSTAAQAQSDQDCEEVDCAADGQFGEVVEGDDSSAWEGEAMAETESADESLESGAAYEEPVETGTTYDEGFDDTPLESDGEAVAELESADEPLESGTASGEPVDAPVETGTASNEGFDDKPVEIGNGIPDGHYNGCGADRTRWESCFGLLGIVEGDAYRGLAPGKNCAACINYYWANGNIDVRDVKECVKHQYCEKSVELGKCLVFQHSDNVFNTPKVYGRCVVSVTGS